MIEICVVWFLTYAVLNINVSQVGGGDHEQKICVCERNIVVFTQLCVTVCFSFAVRSRVWCRVNENLRISRDNEYIYRGSCRLACVSRSIMKVQGLGCHNTFSGHEWRANISLPQNIQGGSHCLKIYRVVLV